MFISTLLQYGSNFRHAYTVLYMLTFPWRVVYFPYKRSMIKGLIHSLVDNVKQNICSANSNFFYFWLPMDTEYVFA
jgi:hypothetical protein